VIVARTTLWAILAASSVAAVLWVSRSSWDQLAARVRWLRDAPMALHESSRLAYVTGTGLGAVVAALILAAAVLLLRA
jgi:hypothetical protein